MDVTCERCSTEYEFDETLVSDRGTTVKCTHCGHLFKVFRPGTGPGGERHWSIRKRDGTTLVLTSLRELQKQITRGELDEDDEISRSGEGWKPLGAIAELRTFFAAARASLPTDAGATRRDSTVPFTTGPAAGPSPFRQSPSASPPGIHEPRAYARTEEADTRGGVPPAPSRGSRSGPLETPPPAGPPRSARGTIMGVGATSSAPPPRTSPKGTIMGVGGSAPPPGPPAGGPDPWIPPPARIPSEAPASGPVRRATPAPRGSVTRRESLEDVERTRDDRPPPRELTPTRAEQAGPRQAPSARPPGRTPSARPAAAAPSERPSARPLYLDDEEGVRPRRRGRAGLWITLVVLLVAVGGGVALAWDQISVMLGIAAPADPVARFIESGDRALEGDHVAAYERAIREYTRGTAIAERDPRLLASLARAHALLAQELDFQADDLEARAAQDPALAGEAAALRRQQGHNAQQARELAEDAVRQDPNLTPAVIALADALRLTGDTSGARSHMGRAEALERDPSADQLRLKALMAMDAAGGDPSAARREAGQAVEKDPKVIRARLLYARALLGGGDVAQARGQIDAVLSDHPEHPGALRLKQAIEQGLPPAAPVVAVLDAGPAPDAGVGETVPEALARTEPGRGEDRTGAGVVPTGRDYSWYVQRGDEALERGDVGRARAFFEAALQKRPGGSEALNGLGWVLMETGEVTSAIRQFSTAANQGYAPALVALGDAYRRSGQGAQALRAYERYLQQSAGRGGAQERRVREHVAELRASGLEGGAGDGAGGGPEEAGGSTAPPTPPGTLPAPRGTDPEDPPPSSDPPAVGSE